jgi:hypothetical protein
MVFAKSLYSKTEPMSQLEGMRAKEYAQIQAQLYCFSDSEPYLAFAENEMQDVEVSLIFCPDRHAIESNL